ncbi:glycosyltransferase [Massilia sp. MS-15]|uniref:glycosyltransferase n=1 Tax=Massilia sp. MS-15 TaxID=2878200 RepID=UPI001CD3C0F0|nr:glycosyltransferase [Massilia sp. MS-15]MCA1248664.1 glycosyltransferase [Massilia sp. MS-15]
MTQPALVVIARDEAPTLARCLESARPFVAEMIVLDTGSSDDTAQIAAACGARVIPFAWNDDYGAARNAALAASSADWNLVLDGDEWIDAAQGDVAGILAQACTAAPALGMLPVRLGFDLAGRGLAATAWRPRLLPRGVRYAGAVDEAPTGELPQGRIPLWIDNDGMRRPERAAKRAQRAGLLLAAQAAAPQDARLAYQAGKLEEARGEHAAAAAHYRHALGLTAPDAAWRHDLVVRAMFTLKMAGQPEEAVHLADLEMDNWQDSPDYYFALGDVLLELASRNPDTAPEVLPMIEASWLRCLELGDQPALEGSVSGRGSFLAAHNLAVLYESQGDAQQAGRFRELASRGA